MLHAKNNVSHQPANLHCVWVPAHTGADAPLAAIWIDTPAPDPGNQEDQERSSGGRCCGAQQEWQSSLETLAAINRRTGERKLKRYRNVSELVDPRPIIGDRLSYRGMALLPVSFECDWMVSSNTLQRAIAKELLAMAREERLW